ncbi:hypothetical protein ILUMI_12939 [Ignelater luminosus]|uniref:G-protein coupled receptors family 1 profile domain-containing protein n=1 Tax=Ignelater luminosus TaxID=2038154 RepID=A0A8K0G6B0_IGNLU|nr:hypothetical protein ILUMI_12939 [Ignelater luminosus]
MSHVVSLLFIAVVIFSSFGILADTAIIYGIYRFKRLKTPSNVFLANWAIADLLSIVTVPTIIVNYVLIFDPSSYIYTCLTTHATVTCHLAVTVFGLLLSIDWCTAAYWPRISDKVRNRYLFIIVAIWLVLLLFYILSSALCISGIHFYFNVIIFVIFYAINLLFVIVLQCTRIVQKCRTGSITYPESLNGRLAIISIITFSYLLAAVNVALEYANVYHSSYDYIATYACTIISAITVLASSVVTLGVLCWFDKNFRLCVFPIGSNTHARFENEVSETEESPATFNNSNHLSNSNQNIVT